MSSCRIANSPVGHWVDEACKRMGGVLSGRTWRHMFA